MANLLIVFACLAVIGLIALWCCKKKGERRPIRHRFPLVDETANSGGSFVETNLEEPDARPESLRFIERSDEEKDEDD